MAQLENGKVVKISEDVAVNSGVTKPASLNPMKTLKIVDVAPKIAVNNVKNVKNAKRAILKAFKNQVEGKGFSLVEVVSTCPTNWGLTPQKALDWLEENMLPYYPLGVYKDKYKDE